MRYVLILMMLICTPAYAVDVTFTIPNKLAQNIAKDACQQLEYEENKRGNETCAQFADRNKNQYFDEQGILNAIRNVAGDDRYERD